MNIVKNILRVIFIRSSIIIYLMFSGNIHAQSLKEISKDTAKTTLGQKLFKNYCASCHGVFEDRGCPPLSGIYERQKIDWLIKFIKNPKEVIESGDEHGKVLFEKYKYYMPNHSFLSDKEVLNILAYIKESTLKGPDNHIEEESNELFINLLLFGVLLLLVAGIILIIFFLKRYFTTKKSK